MKKHSIRIIAFAAMLLFISSQFAFAQNTSNKGTNFWIGYTGHVNHNSSGGTASAMNLYITSDVNTSGTVSIPLNGWSVPFTVTANTTTIVKVDSSLAYVDGSGAIENKGIEVTSLLPIVVYSHIYYQNRSDATLVLPVPTLGKEYYAMSFTQKSTNGSTGYSEFMVIGVEDSTQVQITPTHSTLDGQVANVTFTIKLNQGQVYQLQADSDLTGSHIVTFSSNNSACKRVALFSGNTFDIINLPGSCSNSATSGDNLYQQLYPVNAWGNDFVTVPYKSRTGGDYFRVLAGSDSTFISVNGGPQYRLNTAQFKDTVLTTASYFTATKPITLAQYQTSQVTSGTSSCRTGTGDPSMTILNPVEQTLDTIALYSATKYQITEEFINVIIKSNDTAFFRLDGNHLPFSIVASNPLYSYAQRTVASGNHVLTSDSGFNAIAYGFGQTESYGYSAGANVRNLVQYVNAGSNGIINPHILCKSAVVDFTGVVSYTPSSIKWYFGDGTTSTTASPSHTYTTPGTYTVSFVTTRGSGNSCDIKDSNTYVLNIVGFPVAAFTFTNTCSNDTVHFTDASTGGGGTIVSRRWNFGDGDTSIVQNPLHHYQSDGTYTVTLITHSSGGCFDTAKNQVIITKPPLVNAGPDLNSCAGSSVTLSTTTGSGYTFQWSPAGELSCPTCSSTKVSPADTQTYVIKTSIGVCSANDTVTVNVTKALASISDDTLLMCAGNSVSVSTATKPGQTYLWSPANGLSCLTCSLTTASPSSTTKYTVTATYNSCQAKDSVIVQVVQPGTGPKPDTSICPGESANLRAFPGGAGFSYDWEPNVGLSCQSCRTTVATPSSLPATYYVIISSSTCNHYDSVIIKQEVVLANAGADSIICPGKSTMLSATGGVSYKWSPSAGLNSVVGANPSASPTVNTTYTVVVTDAKGCTGEDNVVISLYPPFAASAGPDTTVCPGAKVTLIATGGISYSWQPASLLNSNSIASPVATVDSNNTVFTASITDARGCVEQEEATIELYPLPLIIAEPDTVICENQPLTLFAFGAVSYVWSGGEILGCNTCSSINVGTPSPATFNVVGTDSRGCKNTATVQFVFSPYCQFVLMPDAFSPNNDGRNDLFRPVGRGIVKIQYSVFDRWGQKVFTGSDLINGWNGKYNGKDMPLGTYSWALSADLIDGTTVKQSGNVTLVR